VREETWGLPDYILDADISTIYSGANNKKIPVIVGITTTDIQAVIELFCRNATNNETYTAYRLWRIAYLAAVEGLMRAIPYRNAEKNRPRTHRNPDPGLFGWFRRVASAVTEALKTVINTITTTLETAFRALQGFVGKIMEGVRLLAAGIMAVAGFIGKLFRDFLHMLMEFGQFVWGFIKKAISIIARLLKFILWAIS